jgi:hypothetical protein
MLKEKVRHAVVEMKDAVHHLVVKIEPVLGKKTKNRNECFFRVI